MVSAQIQDPGWLNTLQVMHFLVVVWEVLLKIAYVK